MKSEDDLRAAPTDEEKRIHRRKGLFGFIRRLKERVEALAASRHALGWLFAIAFAESSFFPIPPDTLLLPLAASAPRRSLRFAFVCTVGSVLGALLGWGIGYLFYDTIGKAILDFYHMTSQVETVLRKYQENAFVAIVIAGFTPIPYKAFTILAGMTTGTAHPVGLPTLLAASVVGRGMRFFLVGGVVRVFGPSVKPLIDKHFEVLTIVFVVLFIVGILALKTLL